MRLLFVADGRSPTARNWIQYWIQRGDEVHLASTFPCDPLPGLAALELAPVAFSGYSAQGGSASPPQRDSRFLQWRNRIRHWLGPLTVSHSAQMLHGIAERVQPDLVHAMRIPYEGMLAANALLSVPLIISTWGNDFTLHAPSSPLMRQHTNWTMLVADALHTDCERDIRLAHKWGLDPTKPTLVAPGNGGVHTDIFFPPPQPVDDPIIFNPRGFRAYIRNDTFFKSVPLVLEKIPNARFICASMAGQPEALDWLKKLGIEKSVELLAPLPQTALAEIYRRSMILVSPSTHDGTPNSLLEGLACGCFPVVGDLESIREWIDDGVNGLLVDSGNPSALAEAIITAIKNKRLRTQAAGLNQSLIANRAEFGHNMVRAEEFYENVKSKR